MPAKKHHPAVVEYIEKEIPVEHIKNAHLDVGHDKVKKKREKKSELSMGVDARTDFKR